MRDVILVGGTMLRFGRYPEKTLPQLGAEAVLGALKDAGVTMKDIQCLAAGSLYNTSGFGQRVLQEIGQTGIPVVNVANACATGSTAFREAYLAVASGAYDCVLALGGEQMGKMGLLGAGRAADEYSTEGIIGTNLMPGTFAMTGVEHMHKYGTTVEQFAKIAAKNHHHSTMNPYSQYRQDYTVEEILNARVVAWPNTLYMCCPTGDGAAAAVLMSAEKARQYTTKPIKVAAAVLTSDPYSERDLTWPDVNTLTRLAAQQAYEQAGITPEDLDQVELHDCFSTAELVHYENLMLCGEGEAGKLVDEGATSLGGRIPVNVSGGLVSKGHPLGATGVANIVEIMWHLREQAGDRQVQGSKVGLAHVIGLGSACTVHILQK